jgi:hypothetical protein
MRTIPDEWYHRKDKLANSSITWPEACMVALLASFTEGRPLAPRTTSSYLSAVKKYLENQGVDTRFFGTSQYITNTRRGIALHYRAVTNRTALDSIRIPITADMILSYHEITTKGAPTLQQRALLVAQLTGFTLVARVSEYLYSTRSNHWLQAGSVQFTLANGAIIPAHMAYKHSTLQPVSLAIMVRSKKNDQAGRGYKYIFTLADAVDRYCYVSEMWQYATRARPTARGPFFAVPAVKWTLRATRLAAHLKSMAKHYHLDHTRISTHSLRIGGASTLAAAGLTDHEIMRVGAWRSTSFLTYLRQNVTLFEKARAALSSAGALTMEEVRPLITTDTRARE